MKITQLALDKRSAAVFNAPIAAVKRHNTTKGIRIMARETKAQMEARIREELQAEAKGTDAKPKAKSKVAIPAWAASSKSEVVGIDTTTGNPYICVARRDGESPAPKIATGGAHAGVGPAKARRFSPDTLAYILDHEKEMRKLIETCGKLSA